MKTNAFLAEVSLLLVAISPAWGTPSGLNNIPTGDTTDQGTVVVQAFGTVGGDGDDNFNLGFKTGFNLGPLDLELGADSRISPGDAGPVTFQAKIAAPVGHGLPILALGMANTTFSGADANRSGEIFGYFVASQDFQFLRAHIGCGLQDEAFLPFVGFDKTITTDSLGLDADKSDRDLFTLRADMIQQQYSSWLYSAGLLLPISKYVVVET